MKNSSVTSNELFSFTNAYITYTFIRIMMKERNERHRKKSSEGYLIIHSMNLILYKCFCIKTFFLKRIQRKVIKILNNKLFSCFKLDNKANTFVKVKQLKNLFF